MIIYKDQRYASTYKALMDQISLLLIKSEDNEDYDWYSELLINLCELETALADHFFNEEESLNHSIQLLRETNIILASALYKLFNKEYIDFELNAVRTNIETISRLKISDKLVISIPEGLAYYSYYPEMFFLSTKRFITECKPEKVICIGIRTIGTIYSAASSAVLKNSGIEVNSYTIRTRGDFENRHIKLSDELKKAFIKNKNDYFLIVDEGPGLSGSSFGAVSKYLKQIGISQSNIFFLATRNPNSKDLISDLGREEWGQYKTFQVNNNDFFFNNLSFFGVEKYQVKDISAGKWRYAIYNNGRSMPPADADNERKKYMLAGEGGKIIMKYLGHGKYGKRFIDRGNKLANEGFIPGILDFKHGFIFYKMENGINLSLPNESFLLNSLKYLSYLKNFQAAPSHAFEEMFQMIIENISEVCGPELAEKIKSLERKFSTMYSNDCYEIDGRILPFEWIITENEYKKLDGLEHHNDHFFPGTQNILWDAAGIIVEFRLNKFQKNYFVELCRIKLNEPETNFRIPFYIIAYSAFRLAYSKLLSDLLNTKIDGIKFSKLKDYYEAVIKNELSNLS